MNSSSTILGHLHYCSPISADNLKLPCRSIKGKQLRNAVMGRSEPSTLHPRWPYPVSLGLDHLRRLQALPAVRDGEWRVWREKEGSPLRPDATQPSPAVSRAQTKAPQGSSTLAPGTSGSRITCPHRVLPPPSFRSQPTLPPSEQVPSAALPTRSQFPCFQGDTYLSCA